MVTRLERVCGAISPYVATGKVHEAVVNTIVDICCPEDERACPGNTAEACIKCWNKEYRRMTSRGRCRRCAYSENMRNSRKLWCGRHGNVCQRVAWGCQSNKPKTLGEALFDPNAQRLIDIDEREKAATKGPWIEIEGFVFSESVPPNEYDFIQGKVVASGSITATGCNANAIFCANARQDIPWMSARIKELEAEVSSARRWARRWKNGMRRKIKEMAELFYETDIENSDLVMDLLHAKNRIAALEKAARICETCTGYKNTGEEPECVECRAWPIGLRKGWTFDEKRYAPRGGANNV